MYTTARIKRTSTPPDFKTAVAHLNGSGRDSLPNKWNPAERSVRCKFAFLRLGGGALGELLKGVSAVYEAEADLMTAAIFSRRLHCRASMGKWLRFDVRWRQKGELAPNRPPKTRTYERISLKEKLRKIADVPFDVSNSGSLLAVVVLCHFLFYLLSTHLCANKDLAVGRLTLIKKIDSLLRVFRLVAWAVQHRRHRKKGGI